MAWSESCRILAIVPLQETSITFASSMTVFSMKSTLVKANRKVNEIEIIFRHQRHRTKAVEPSPPLPPSPALWAPLASLASDAPSERLSAIIIIPEDTARGKQELSCLASRLLAFYRPQPSCCPRRPGTVKPTSSVRCEVICSFMMT